MSSRRKSPFRDWRRAHLPRTSALLDGEIDHYLALAELEHERVLEAQRADACCIECHSLMLVTDGGHHYCPFQLARAHERAIEHMRAELLAIAAMLLEEAYGNRFDHGRIQRAA